VVVIAPGSSWALRRAPKDEQPERLQIRKGIRETALTLKCMQIARV